VRVDGTRFVVDGRPHAFVGVNFWQAMNLAVADPRAGGDRARLVRELDRLRALGVTNLRILAGSEGPEDAPYRIAPPLLRAPATYDARLLDGLDFVLDACAARGLRVVMVLTNFWEWSGGMAQYVAWSDGSEIPYPETHVWTDFTDYASRFYDCGACQVWYHNHIGLLLRRRNALNGRLYREDPTIFAWELANEPRLYPVSWIEETARYLHRLDPNHLVTTGSEGRVGGEFVPTHAVAGIDYATIHLWPQNWGWFEPADPTSFEHAKFEARTYLDAHAADALRLGKPLVVEEFGLARDFAARGDPYDPRSTTALRDALFRLVFERVEGSLAGDGPFAGSNLWAWSGEARPGDAWVGDPPHERPGWYSVYDADATTLEALRAHALALDNPAATPR